MQYTDHTRLRAYVFGIPTQCFNGFFTGSKQRVVHLFRILQAKHIQLMRQGKNHMKICDRQQVLFAGFYPSLPVCALAFGAMTITAGIVTYPKMTTAIALIYMSTHGGRAAMFNRMENLEVISRWGMPFYK
jgi:hypothetical protein